MTTRQINGGGGNNAHLSYTPSNSNASHNPAPYPRWFYAIFGLFILLYASFIIADSAFPMLNGDSISFYQQLLESKSAWHGLDTDMKRFFPFAGWNLALIAQFSTSPYAFMLGNACVLVVFSLCFIYLARMSGARAWWSLVMLVCIVLSAGYTKLLVEIVFPETTQTMFMLLFLCCCFGVYRLDAKAESSADSKCSWKILGLGALALVFGNAVIYLKEVSFIIVSGFGFLHVALSYLAQKRRANSLEKRPLSKRIIIFDSLLMLSGVVFLLVYALATHGAQNNYASAVEVFSPLRTIIVLFLSAPFLSLALPVIMVLRVRSLLSGEAEVNVFWDSLALIALGYMGAFLVLGMGSFHYFMPANILAALYLLFFLANHNFTRLEKLARNLVLAFTGFILCTSSVPLGIHYLTLNKAQNRNINDTMSFLADYIRDHTHTRIYFEGFGRGRDLYYGSWSYGAFFNILPSVYGVHNFDIASKEPNGKNFTLDLKSPLSFFNSKEVRTPDSSDLLIITALSDVGVLDSRIAELESSHELLFKTSNHPYFPQYTLMSIGAKLLQDWHISHPLSNYGNPYRLPAQSYVFRIR
ncbi:hypothetical protein F4V45_03505 [Helicobacter canis]|uniref:Glycosyltransferase RgtA/B/C/D-like domain-containing protein n=2 Tax=Helicobacter canis TaxID=29419 RepID=A0A5M9QPQ1_9HELI|nr:hypothetical protein [Helicobacter canis]KAA8710049.1 hypothetical protein F4V45_03505 [Helicobacter canis]